MQRMKLVVVVTCVLGCLASTLLTPAFGSGGFTAFAEDEDVCRQVGAAAIQGASGPTAAHRYDGAYRGCMFAHGRDRQMRDYADQAEYGIPGKPNGDFPDAYYSVPYATPGYGYDGFSY